MDKPYKISSSFYLPKVLILPDSRLAISDLYRITYDGLIRICDTHISKSLENT